MERTLKFIRIVLIGCLPSLVLLSVGWYQASHPNYSKDPDPDILLITSTPIFLISLVISLLFAWGRTAW